MEELEKQFKCLKKQAKNIKEYCLVTEVMDINGFTQDDLEILYERLIAYINAIEEISKLPPSSNKSALMLEQDEQLLTFIDGVNPQFAYILTPDLATVANIQDRAWFLAGGVIPGESLSDGTTKEMENLDFNLLKKQADSIRGYWLHPMVMDKQFYQQSDIEALYEKLIAYINAMQEISENSDLKKNAFILDQVEALVEYINGFEQQFKAVETEDREHICDLINSGAILAGFLLKPEKNSDFDLTREWRKW